MSNKPEPDEVRRVAAEADLLHSGEQVEAALDRMGEEITQRLGEKNPVLLCVMTGAVVPTGCLLNRLDFPLELDYLHATRYTGEVRGGRIEWLMRPSTPLKGRTVLVVDDILDEGITLAEILDYCRDEGAEEVYCAVLVDKLHQRKPRLKRADFTGLETGDRYLFGYGMDYKGYLRNARGIYAVRGL